MDKGRKGDSTDQEKMLREGHRLKQLKYWLSETWFPVSYMPQEGF